MGRMRFVMILAAAALLVPGAAVAATPQFYVANGSGYSVAFAGEAGQVSVLGLDAQSYCSYTEPTELLKPGLSHRFAAPVSMGVGPTGLTYRKHEVEMSEKVYSAEFRITANFSGEALTGDFSDIGQSEIESLHCQTGTYYGGAAAVPFEAVPYVPFGRPEAAAPVAGEIPDYFGRQGPLEVFIRKEGGVAMVRGAVVSKCKFGGDHKSTRTPFFGIPYPFKLDGEGRFSRRFEKNAGHVKGDVVNEVMRISATVEEAAIDGTYFRRSIAGEGADARKCTIGPLHFHADRYVPRVG